MDTNTLFTMALGLAAPWEVKDLRFDAEGRRLDIEVDFTRGSEFPCPVCGVFSKVHDTEQKTWRHLDFFQHAAYLSARVPRCRCGEHGVKQVPVPWARAGSGFTLLFEALIMTLVQAMPEAAAARIIGEYDGKLWRVVHHHVDEARAKVDISKVIHIGMDETAARRGQDYITHVMDMDGKRVLFAVEGRGHETLKAFKAGLEAHHGEPEKIEEACLDMSSAFIWLKNPSNLTAHQQETLEDLRDRNLRTAEAYRMKLTLQDFYEQPDPKAAKWFLEEWCQMAETSGMEPMAKVAKTLREHVDGVLRWFTSRLANGLLEGINSLIQAAKAKARGYRTTRNLIAIVYLIAGKLNLPALPGRVPATHPI